MTPPKIGGSGINPRQMAFDFEAPKRPATSLSQTWAVDEIYQNADEQLLKSVFEDRRIERKPAGTHAEAIGQYIAMWANTPDGGLIALGMEDDGRITGCKKLAAVTLNELERAGTVYAADAVVRTKRVPAKNIKGDDDFIVLYRVEYNPSVAVKTASGNYYVRISDTKRHLKKLEEIEQLRSDKGEISFELRDTDLKYPDDFDTSAIHAFCNEVRNRKRTSTGQTDTEILCCEHLGRRRQGDFVPNMACVLLFAHDPARSIPGCRVRIMKFDGEQEYTGERYNEVLGLPPIMGTVPFLITETARILAGGQLRTFQRLGKDGKFYTSPEYPPDAWYEAIVNACVHRSYGNGMKNMNVFVKLFEDRMEVESPGPLPPNVTPENIYFTHHPRNPHLMNALLYMEFVRCAHEGTRRMRDTMASAELPPPKFKQIDDTHSLVKVTLKNNSKQRKAWIDSDASGLVGAAIFAELTENERRAINFIAEYGSINVSELQRLTGAIWDTSKKTLMGLVRKKILVAKRTKPAGERDPGARFELRKARPTQG